METSDRKESVEKSRKDLNEDEMEAQRLEEEERMLQATVGKGFPIFPYPTPSTSTPREYTGFGRGKKLMVSGLSTLDESP